MAPLHGAGAVSAGLGRRGGARRVPRADRRARLPARPRRSARGARGGHPRASRHDLRPQRRAAGRQRADELRVDRPAAGELHQHRSGAAWRRPGRRARAAGATHRRRKSALRLLGAPGAAACRQGSGGAGHRGRPHRPLVASFLPCRGDLGPCRRAHGHRRCRPGGRRTRLRRRADGRARSEARAARPHGPRPAQPRLSARAEARRGPAPLFGPALAVSRLPRAEGRGAASRRVFRVAGDAGRRRRAPAGARQSAVLQSQRLDAARLGRRAQPGGHRRLRTRLHDQAADGAGRLGERPLFAGDGSGHIPRLPAHRQQDH